MSNLTNNTAQLEALLVKVNALPNAGSGGASAMAKGVITSDSQGYLTIPSPGFTPKHITIWNITKIDQWGGVPDEQIVHYLYDGIMLSAIRFEDGRWVAQTLLTASGSTVICQASAEDRGVFQDGADYGTTNIIEEDGTITWHLGIDLEGGEDSYMDFSDTEFNYVITG